MAVTLFVFKSFFNYPQKLQIMNFQVKSLEVHSTIVQCKLYSFKMLKILRIRVEPCKM